MFVVLQMEQLMDRMQDESTGIPVRTVNRFRAKVPSVFTGTFNRLQSHTHLTVSFEIFLQEPI